MAKTANGEMSHITMLDGEWGMYYGSNGATCIRHFGCEKNSRGLGDGARTGTCGCSGSCHTCNLKAPDEIMGFRKMIQWKR